MVSVVVDYAQVATMIEIPFLRLLKSDFDRNVSSCYLIFEKEIRIKWLFRFIEINEVSCIMLDRQALSSLIS